MPPAVTRDNIHISDAQYSCLPYNSENRAVLLPQNCVKRLVSCAVCEVGTGFLCMIYVNVRFQKVNNCEPSTEGLVYGTKCWGTHAAGLLNERLMCVFVRLTNFALPCFSDFITVLLSMCIYMTRSKFSYCSNFIQGVPGGMCQTSGECSLR